VTISKDFFGHMTQGDWIEDDGSLRYPESHPVTVFIGLLRLWDSRSVWRSLYDATSASYYWPGLEANLAYAARIGAEVMFTFGAPPSELCRVGSRNVPTVEAWQAFVGAVVDQSRGRINYWELWNEATEADYWDGSAEELAVYASIAAQIIRAGSPVSTVLSPSMVEIDTTRQAFTQRYFTTGGAKFVDVVAFHGYTETPLLILNDIAVLRAMMRKSGIDKPLWNTEFNVLPEDPAILPAWIAQSLIIQASQGLLGAVWDPETGDVAQDYTSDATKQVADWLIGATVGPLESEGNTTYCVVSRAGQADQELSWIENSFPVLGSVRRRPQPTPKPAPKPGKRGCLLFFLPSL
jgi:hypothetical protein